MATKKPAAAAAQTMAAAAEPLAILHADPHGVQAGVDLATRFRAPHHGTIGTVHIPDGDGATQEGKYIVLPEGMRTESVKRYLDEFRTRPERRDGTAELRTLASLIDHANRLKDDDSALFAWPDPADPTLTCVFDYHERRNVPDADAGDPPVHRPGALPRFGLHRALYPFPLSIEWQAWKAQDGKAMDQGKFAEFIEDRIADVIEPHPGLLRESAEPAIAAAGGDFGPKTPQEELAYLVRTLGGQIASPSRMVELSRGLAVHVGEQVKGFTNLSNGETQIAYTAAHQDNQGQPLKVPSLFLIGIPVFAEGTPYLIAVRLRYRVQNGAVVWFYQLYRVDRSFDHAFREACSKAAAETGLPLYYGKPEE